MSIKRCLSRSAESPVLSEKKIGDAAARIFDLLWNGHYMDEVGRRCQMRGDVSKISKIIGLTPTEQMLLRNYHFMSSRLQGTRQVRRSINHVIFSARCIYGCPVFMTVTPSERHSGLAIRLSRYRRHDPGGTRSAQDFLPYIGYDAPSLYPADHDGER